MLSTNADQLLGNATAALVRRLGAREIGRSPDLQAGARIWWYVTRLGPVSFLGLVLEATSPRVRRAGLWRSCRWSSGRPPVATQSDLICLPAVATAIGRG